MCQMSILAGARQTGTFHLKKIFKIIGVTFLFQNWIESGLKISEKIKV